MAAAREGRRGAGPRVEGLPVLRGKHGADLNLAVTFDAVPDTVLGTHAASVFRQSWRSSTGCPLIRSRHRGVCPAVHVCGMPRSGADL
jgi:hypothetical protein